MIAQSRTIKFLFGMFAVSSLYACDSNLPISLRTDEKLVFVTLGKDRYAVPVNYVDSFGTEILFVMMAWPSLEGRTNENYTEYARNNISVLINSDSNTDWTPAQAKRGMAVAYDVYVSDDTGPDDIISAKDKQFGFDHYVVEYAKTSRVRDDMEGYEYRNTMHVYERKANDGSLEAFMKCNGNPPTDRERSECTLWANYPEFPQMEFKISFPRSTGAQDVLQIEAAVRAKFMTWKTAGTLAKAEGRDK